METAASEVEVEVIDLTGLSSDSSGSEDDEEVTNEELSGQEGDEDVEELVIDDATRKALHVAIATAPSPRLRQVVALLVDNSPDFELAAAKHLVTRKGRAQKAIPRYDLCANCLDEYDTRAERLDEECIFHPGELECNEGAFVDWDEAVHGPMDTEDNQREYPENFNWTCCEADGTSPGCLKGHHTNESPNKRRRMSP